MRLWALFCLSACALAAQGAPPSDEEVHTPVEFLRIATTTESELAELKPLIQKSIGSSGGLDGLASRDNPLAALLARQRSCPSGYGECNNPGGRCCPLGGRCCSGSGCCRSGYFCYSSGCCRVTERGCEGNSCCSPGASCCSGGGCCGAGDYCAVANGRRGCCPIGRICSGSSGQCSSSGYTRCPGEDFCCPTGDTCYRDDAGQGRCRSSSGGGGGGGGGGGVTTTSQRITTSAPTSTPITTIPPITRNSPITTTAVIPRPTAPSGSQVIQVAPSDPRVVYNGAWQTTTSACNSTTQSRMASDSYSSFSFSFQGSAVYLSLSTFNAWYTVTVGGETTDYGTTTSTVAPSNCTLSFGQTGLATSLQSLVVYVYGASMMSTSSEPWSFALNEISLVTSDSAAISTTRTSNPSQNTVVGGNVNGAPPPSNCFARVMILMPMILVILLALI